jgi:hypothetical protein
MTNFFKSQYIKVCPNFYKHIFLIYVELSGLKFIYIGQLTLPVTFVVLCLYFFDIYRKSIGLLK